MKSFKSHINEQSTLRVVDLAKARWQTRAGKTGFSKQSGVWGIQRDDGKVLSKNGDPVVWDRKNLVQTQILPYANDFKNHDWLDIEF